MVAFSDESCCLPNATQAGGQTKCQPMTLQEVGKQDGQANNTLEEQVPWHLLPSPKSSPKGREQEEKWVERFLIWDWICRRPYLHQSLGSRTMAEPRFFELAYYCSLPGCAVTISRTIKLNPGDSSP